MAFTIANEPWWTAIISDLLIWLIKPVCVQPPIEEDDQSLEGPSPPLSAGSFVQELFQAQYRYALCPVLSMFFPVWPHYLCYIKGFIVSSTDLLLLAHIAKSRAILSIPSSASPYRSHCHTHGELLSWADTFLHVLFITGLWGLYSNPLCIKKVHIYMYKNLFLRIKKSCLFYLLHFSTKYASLMYFKLFQGMAPFIEVQTLCVWECVCVDKFTRTWSKYMCCCKRRNVTWWVRSVWRVEGAGGAANRCGRRSVNFQTKTTVCSF